jgi:hypothetical protein
MRWGMVWTGTFSIPARGLRGRIQAAIETIQSNFWGPQWPSKSMVSLNDVVNYLQKKSV